MLSSYYDSDEEIAWGPLTLKEIKKELSTKRPVKDRHSINITKPRMDGLDTTQYDTAEEDIHRQSNNDNTTYQTAESVCSEYSIVDGNSFKTASKIDEISYQTSNNSIINSDNDDNNNEEVEIQQSNRIGIENQIIDISSDDKENIDGIDDGLIIVKQENSSNHPDYTNSNIETIDLCSDDDEQLSNHINDDSTDTNSYIFNDTLEEMENALKELQTPSYNNNRTIEPPQHCNEKNFITKKRPQLNKYDYIVSPVGEYIRERSPTIEKFKTPKPVSKRTFTTPNPINKQLRNIVSPVAFYIKNTPTTPLRQNMQSNVCISEKRVLTPQIQINHNIVDDLPKTMYKPSKRTVQYGVDTPNLPSSIKNMVKLPVVAKHLEKTKKINESLIDNMADEDLTLMCDATIDSSVDISICQNKQVFIK